MKLYFDKWCRVCLVLLLSLLGGGCGGGDGGGGAAATTVSIDTVQTSRNMLPAASLSAEQVVVSGFNGMGLAEMNSMAGLSVLVSIENSYYGYRNQVIAPFYLAKSLARLTTGASGQTQSALCSLMHLSSCGPDLDTIFNDLDLGINRRIAASALDGVSSQASSAAWSQAGYGFRPAYLNGLAANYGTRFEAHDFAMNLSGERGKLDDWCKNGSGLWSSVTLSKDTRLVLSDAATFNAGWKVPFDPAQTKLGNFLTCDYSVAVVPFFRGTVTVKQKTGAGYRAFQLPLDGDQQFLVILPDEGKFFEIAKALDASTFQDIVASLAPAQVDLAIPKFSFTNYLNLNLGVASIKDSADFSGIDATKDLYVASATHASSFSISEAGVKAGSVIQIGLDDAHPEYWNEYGAISVDSTRSLSDVSVFLGRPFVFAVLDSATGTVLYLGWMMDPSR